VKYVESKRQEIGIASCSEAGFDVADGECDDFDDGMTQALCEATKDPPKRKAAPQIGALADSSDVEGASRVVAKRPRTDTQTDAPPPTSTTLTTDQQTDLTQPVSIFTTYILGSLHHILTAYLLYMYYDFIAFIYCIFTRSLVYI
jgi:hypothetical protein